MGVVWGSGVKDESASCVVMSECECECALICVPALMRRST